MDGMPLGADKVYEAITTSAKRKKIVVSKRETSDPKAIHQARNLGKELFAEVGPDGEDALRSFLQGKLKDWKDTLAAFKTVGGYRELSWRGADLGRPFPDQSAVER
jgi:hypothetical protein